VSELDTDLQPLKVEIQAKLQAIEGFEEVRRHRLSELQAQLAEARSTFTESHPVVSDLKQSIVALSVESPEVTTLRQEALSLKGEYDRKSAASDAPASAMATQPFDNALVRMATPPQLPSDVLHVALDLREERDPGMVYARGQLRDAMDKYAALRSQIQTAQIDLETAQAAFKYRYSVVTPARLPTSPTQPNVPVVLLAAVVAAIFWSLLFPVLVDIRAGRLLERWQIEHILGRPILGEITLPRTDGMGFE